ncbi:MAG: GGDEF domain-containing protein, partial [Spirochaetales bacterium]|nr:GGDEF domain-containing protein [Spirochaetales bacterium]
MAEVMELKKVEIFSDLDTDEIRELASSLRRQSLSKDEVLFNEGDSGSELFIVESGSLGVRVKTQDGTDLDVAEFGPGDFFGEMSIFEQEPRSATCYARSDSDLLSLHEKELLNLIENSPASSIKMMLRMLRITRGRLDNTGSFLSEMVQWGEAARKRSITDELTGFYNRRYLDESLPGLVKAASHSGQPFGICMMDLDHFRNINEELSHAIGDQIIQGVVAVLNEVLLPKDVPIRYGGDEFVILMPESTPADAEKRAKKVCTSIAALKILESYSCSVKQ